VKIEDAFWQPRIETNRIVTIPSDFRKCEETDRVANFERAAGLLDGPFVGDYEFNDSDVYKVIEGAATPGRSSGPDMKPVSPRNRKDRRRPAARRLPPTPRVTIDPYHVPAHSGPERCST
jgi:hypothetical protein